MFEALLTKIIGSAYAQELIPCPDGTLADPSIGCVETPGIIINPESNLINIILQLADGLLLFVAGIATISLIYGGIKYATSIGNEAELSRAKRILFWSIFGLIVALLAKFVVGTVTGIVS